jgi:hypothetical protein
VCTGSDSCPCARKHPAARQASDCTGNDTLGGSEPSSAVEQKSVTSGIETSLVPHSYSGTKQASQRLISAILWRRSYADKDKPPGYTGFAGGLEGRTRILHPANCGRSRLVCGSISIGSPSRYGCEATTVRPKPRPGPSDEVRTPVMLNRSLNALMRRVYHG